MIGAYVWGRRAGELVFGQCLLRREASRSPPLRLLSPPSLPIPGPGHRREVDLRTIDLLDLLHVLLIVLI